MAKGRTVCNAWGQVAGLERTDPMVADRARGGVVVGIDAWPLGQGVLDLAADEAHRRRTGLHVLHAYPWMAEARQWDFEPPPDELAAAEEIVAAAAARAGARHAGLAVTTEVVVLDPAMALVDASAGAHVVVVGARGHAAEKAHLGKVADDVVAHARAPVVVVRAAPADPDGPVVVGMDPREGAAEAMEYAYSDARRRGVGLTVVQGLQSEGLRRVWENLDVQARADEVVARAEEQTRTRLQAWQARFPDVPTTLEQVRDDPVDALTAASAGAAIVVVGSHGRGNLLGRLLGSVSRGVLQRVPVVAVVRSPHRGDGGAPRS